MKHLIIGFFILQLLGSCKNESLITQEYLLGKWVIVEASRNNKKTSTLDGAYFIFDETALETNFQGGEGQANYTLEHNLLKLTNGMDYTFHLSKTTDEHLIMSTKIQNTSFEFKLKKE